MSSETVVECVYAFQPGTDNTEDVTVLKRKGPKASCLLHTGHIQGAAAETVG